MDVFHHGQGEVAHEFVCDRLVVQQLCDRPVARVDCRDNTHGDLEAQLRADVVRFAEVVVAHLMASGGGVVMLLNNEIVVQQDETKV